MRADGGEAQTVDARSPKDADAVLTVRVKDGPHALEIKGAGGGAVRIYGVVLERDRPGVVWDSLGMKGVRSWKLLNPDPQHWKRQLALRRPDLMVIMLGGNDLVERGTGPQWYKRRFREVLRRFRESRPQAACLVLAPVDHGERHRGRVRTLPVLKRLLPMQREAAIAEGCAFFDTVAAMGGYGAAGRWRKKRPPLMEGDWAHLTRFGSRVLGTRIYRALIAGFVRYLKSVE